MMDGQSDDTRHLAGTTAQAGVGASRSHRNLGHKRTDDRLLLSRARLVTLTLLASGCATRNLSSGGKETSVLGGAVTVATESFQPTPPTTIDADTSKLVGKNGPSGKKVSLFWGLITLHDY